MTDQHPDHPEGPTTSHASNPPVDVTELPLEPRCRVCRNDQIRKKVNDMLAEGATYAMIVRNLEPDNVKLDTRERVTIDSVRNHTARHFPVQNAAKAVYREILERRAKENLVDFIGGVGTAITPMAFLETVIVRSYENLVDSETKVDVNAGMTAAGRLQSLLDSRSGQPDMAQILVKMNRVIDAVRSTVPESMWPELIRKIEGGEGSAQRLDRKNETGDAAIEEFDPPEFVEDDDDF